uniref:hypothetical protein n=1 Tax=Pararhizobium sp. IMCC3301 TaxID=3067904 RepID=UPI002741D381|nr:hypothetical protein [Pararhizobium sp. IMCC3301]
MQQFTTNTYWMCPECENANNQKVPVPELNFMAEKMSDMVVDDWVEIECDHCETAYSGHVFVNTGDVHFEIEEPRKFEFSGDMPMYEPDEEDYDPPDDPYSVSKEALGYLNGMVGSQSPINDPQFTNRLIFSGAVSSLEAYLGDTLINAVLGRSEVREQLLKSNKLLGELKFSAADLANDPESVAKRVIVVLRAVLYHNLNAVSALYKDAFGLDLIPSKSQRDILFPAMMLRHHCVHRNGQDKEGNKLGDFTDDYVRRVIEAIGEVIDHLEGKLTENFPF